MFANVTEGRVTEIVCQARSLNHLWINSHPFRQLRLFTDAVLCQSPPDLGHLDGVLLPRVEDVGLPSPNDLSNAR